MFFSCYRGCWHEVSQNLFIRQVIIFPYKRGLQQISCHPSRNIAGSSFRSLSNIPYCWLIKSLGLVSVPVWLITLSNQLKIVSLVGFNYQLPNLAQVYPLTKIILLKGILILIKGQPLVYYSPVRYNKNFIIKLACIKPVTSVHSEPGSNSSYRVYSLKLVKH